MSAVSGIEVSPFYKRVSSFITDLDLADGDDDDLTAEIVRYALHISSKARSRNLRKLAFKLNRLTEVAHFKDQYLNSSAYINRTLWSAVLEKVKNNKKPSTKDLRLDVHFCLNWLKDSDREFLKGQQCDERLNVDNIDLTKWSNGKYKTLADYAKSKIHKLNFLSMYDPSMDTEDFVQDVLCEFVRVFNSYHRSKGVITDEPIEQRVTKYIDKAIGNKIKSMIDYYTSNSRRRIVSTMDKKYKKIKALKKKKDENQDYDAQILQLKNSIKMNDENYYATTCELNMSYDPEEDVKQPITVEEAANYNDSYSADAIIESVWIRELDENIKDKRTYDYLMAVIGQNNDFDNWVGQNGSKRDIENVDGNRQNTVCKLAKSYVLSKELEGLYGNSNSVGKWKPHELQYDYDLFKCFA